MLVQEEAETAVNTDESESKLKGKNRTKTAKTNGTKRKKMDEVGGAQGREKMWDMSVRTKRMTELLSAQVQ